MPAAEPDSPNYDVIVIGGALAGASTALLLCREHPGLRVCILERSETHKRRVGEATVEVGTWFLGRWVGLMGHLNDNHISKQGLRFWHFKSPDDDLETCSEIGGRYLARVASFLVDRAVLDEEVLRRATAGGATTIRCAAVQSVQLNSGGRQVVGYKAPSGEEVELTCRWLVDASGSAAFLARREGWWRPNDEHPTAAAWSRWRGVGNWDDPGLVARHPKLSNGFFGIRHTATTHLMGDGWWAWMIALKGGDVSVGVVFDQRRMEWASEGSMAERLKTFLCRHPAGRELMKDAECVDGDIHWRRNLAYSSTTLAGDGFVLVGDAAGFLDPFYSPGIDWLSYTVGSAVHMIGESLRGAPVAEVVSRYNRDFGRSYKRWFTALYKDKYDYMGEHDLLKLAFLMDLGLYYLGVASQPYRGGVRHLREPIFSTAPSTPFYHLMRTYNRRFARMARERRRRGRLGESNTGRRFMFGGYTFGMGSAKHVAAALIGWLVLELREGWRTWFRSEPMQDSAVSLQLATAAVPCKASAQPPAA